MMKKIFVSFLLVVGFVCGARAELKVDIVAGATEPISIAVQKFQMGCVKKMLPQFVRS